MSQIVAITGTQDFLRRRQVTTTIADHQRKGWKIQIVDGARESDLHGALSQGSGLFADSTPVLVVVQNPEKVAVETLEAQAAEKEGVTLLLDYDGDPKANTKFGKFVLGLPKKLHKAYPLAEKKWEIPKQAVDFCMAEAERLQHPMDEVVAQALVNRCGVDYGFLSFEIDKFAILAEARKVPNIRAEELRDACVPLGAPPYEGIKSGLIRRKAKDLARALDKAQDKAPMPICGFLESLVIGRKATDGMPSSAGWYHLAYLVGQGLGPEKIATQLGLHPWRCQNILLPEVRRWPAADVLQLLQIAAETKRAVVTGQILPWISLKVKLLNLMRD